MALGKAIPFRATGSAAIASSLIPTAANVLLSKSYAAGTSIEIEVTNQAGAAGNTLYLFGFLF